MNYEVFNPRNHQDDVLNAFIRFTRKFGYVYDGENRLVPAAANSADLIATWKDKDKARLFLSRAVSDEFLDDFEASIAEADRVDISFTSLVDNMKTRYTPNTNKVRNHYLFHRLKQTPSESFDDFVHKVRTNATLCDFKCNSPNCTVLNTLIRDQIISGTNNGHIRDEGLKKQWELDDLVKEGRIIESGALAASEIKKDNAKLDPNINRTKTGGSRKNQQRERSNKFMCFKCEEDSCPGFNKCKFRNKTCPVCNLRGHTAKSRFCKGKPDKKKKNFKNEKKVTNRTEALSSEASSTESEEYSSDDDKKTVNKLTKVLPKILTIKSTSPNLSETPLNVTYLPASNAARRVVGRRQQQKPCRRRKVDFHTEIIVDQSLVRFLVDTGADVNVMSRRVAKEIGITWRKSKTQLRPYGSKPLKVCGVYTGPLIYKNTEVKTEIFIVKQPLESLISGVTAEELGLISFHASDEVGYVNVLEEDDNRTNSMDSLDQTPVSDDLLINSYIQKYHEQFQGIGKCNKIITLHQTDNPKPVIQPQRPIPFHLRSKFDNECNQLLQKGIFEEVDGPSEWISNPVIVPKPDGDIRITIDYRNLNNSLLNSHHPIPRIDELRASMNGCQYFSKLDLRQAYFQFPLSEESKKLTTFYANGRLLRLSRLPQGALPASSELNNALRQIFSGIPEVFVIHDDIIIATKSQEEHYIILEKVLELLKEHNLTLKGPKCIFLSQNIPFWGMRFTSKGIKPCPDKCKALQEMSPPQKKEDVASFISLLQSHSKFIPMFAKLTCNIRALQRKNATFRWTSVHQKEFDTIKEYFKDSTTLSFFNPDLPTWIFVDASKQGLSAVIAQGIDITNTNVVAFASRTTTDVEKRYPQIDLEAMAIDFGLRRFREYCVGGKNINVVTDHKPLKPIFENKRLGSIRIDRTKLRHQDIDYHIIWRQGKINPADYLSRHPSKATPVHESEASEDAKLLYVLHNDTFFMEEVSPKRIVEETQKDSILQAVMKHVHDGSKPSPKELKYFSNIFDELTISDTGLLLRQHRVILPETLRKETIKKVHCMGHFGCSGFKRQIRAHFDFPHLDDLVETEVKNCADCQLFTKKTVKNPLTHVYVPTKAWEYVSVDFFGPMPGGEHVLVVQDLCTKYPVASLLKNGTSAKATIDVLDEIFTNFGRPSRYRSDNGPPFSSAAFTLYMDNIGVKNDRSYPYRPQSNPVETWMKPLGKRLKIAQHNKKAKEKAIRELLMAYRTTPHPATGLSPGEMLFRHGYRGVFPTRSSCSSPDFQRAVKKMKDDKRERCDNINKSVKRKSHSFSIGQWVYVRNRIRNKFDPLYYEDPWVIESIEKNGVIVHNAQLSKRKRRHVDDIKPYIKLDNTHLVIKTPSLETPKSKAFYTLPPQIVENNLHTTASLPLDTDVSADNRRDGEELTEHTLPTPQGSSAAECIMERKRQLPPVGHSVAERVKRRHKRKEDT